MAVSDRFHEIVVFEWWLDCVANCDSRHPAHCPQRYPVARETVEGGFTFHSATLTVIWDKKYNIVDF